MAGKKRPRNAPSAGRTTDLEIPDWLPAPVRTFAQTEYVRLVRDAEAIQVLRRLVSDSRMERVWNELLRRERVNYKSAKAFVHPASQPGRDSSWTPEARYWRHRAQELRRLGGRENDREADDLVLMANISELGEVMFLLGDDSEDESPQDLALAFVLLQALKLAKEKPRPVSLAESRKVRHHYETMAKIIRAEAVAHKHDARLCEAAFLYDAMADKAAPAAGSPLLVKRKRASDERALGFVRALATTTREIFGARLCGTIATIANVALERTDLTSAIVRKMLDSRPCP
jgi:hypothetical protein